MALESSTLQNYNTQLVNCIDEMRGKRETVIKKITTREDEKRSLIETMTKLQSDLTKVEEDLIKYNTAKAKYDQTIQETETAYMKILESSQTLLHVLKRESTKISKKE